MSRQEDDTRVGLPVSMWPEIDQQVWQQALLNCRTPFRQDGGGRCLSQPTLLKSEKGLRRWLGFLARRGELSEGVSPNKRLTLERLDSYFEHLQSCGNADRSVIGRFEELQSALTLMYPGQDFSWVTKPYGIPLSNQLEMRVRNPFIPGSRELLTWATDLFRSGTELQDTRARCSQVRDAVMIALLATLAPRQRALTSLRLGVHVQRVGSEWMLNQTPSITKAGKSLVLPISGEVAVMLERYLEVERPELLNGGVRDSLWISWYGTPLSTSGIVNMLWRRSRARFGVGFSTHRFRTSLTTTATLEAPDRPFDAALILGHGVKVSLANYNRAKAIAASQRHQRRLARLRCDTEKMAKLAFKNRDYLGP